MTLRDWFAGMALQGMLASGHYTDGCEMDRSKRFHAKTLGCYHADIPEDEDRPGPTYLSESKKCRLEYDDDAKSGFLTFDCVRQSYEIADAMLAARERKEES
jgi:hypothetical protein